jgi:hypothetical protein
MWGFTNTARQDHGMSKKTIRITPIIKNANENAKKPS